MTSGHGVRRLRGILAMAVVLCLSVSIAGTPARARAAAATAAPSGLRVGVVRSVVSQAWVDAYGRGYGILSKEEAVVTYLRSRGWDVDVLSDADLEDLAKLKQYDAVVLTYVFGMSPAAGKTLTSYVEQGGGIVTLFASPRVAPGYVGTERGDHWVYIMGHQGWEWGPLSEVYQTYFIDDVGAMKFVNTPVADDPVAVGAAAVLTARGYSDPTLTMYRDQAPGAWIEYVRTLKGNQNTAVIMRLKQLKEPTVSRNYSIEAGAGAVRSTYMRGRAVYFYHSLADYLQNQDGSGYQTVGGIPQRDIAGAWLESAISWVAAHGGRPGVLVRDGRASGSVNVYRDGIYATVSVSNPGNVSVIGTLRFRVYDPSGRLVKESVRYKIGCEPGAVQKYAESYVTGRLQSGYYLVVVEYQTTYPAYARRYVESVRVYRGQGVGIKTSFDRARSTGQVVFDPRVDRVAGPDRYATALAIAKDAGGYPRDGGWVVIAAGDGPDALTASGLAGALDAPLLLTPPAALPREVDSWLRDPSNGFKRAVVVGGDEVVSAGVLDRLAQIFGQQAVERVSGDDRYATSLAVLERLRAASGDAYDGGVLIVNGHALADGAAASAIAYGRRRPIVFVRQTGFDEQAKTALEAIAAQRPGAPAYVVGGDTVVSPATADDLRTLGFSVARAAGADRYETAAKLADIASASGSGWGVFGVASGRTLADALTIGSLVGRFDGPVLLTDGSTLPAPAATRIGDRAQEVQRAVIAGGSGAVSHDVGAAISRLLP